MNSGNTTSGAYQLWQHNNISRLELSSILLGPIRWSSAPEQSIADQVIANEIYKYQNLNTATRFEESKSARAAIEEFATLEENWDGYGAASISQEARDNALEFVSVIEAAPFTILAPEIMPRPSGTISFEWETSHAEAYLEIGDTRYSGFVKAAQQQPTFLEGDADYLDQRVLALIRNALSLPTRSASIREIHIRTPRNEFSPA
jgi:hypothetical protein